MGMMGESWDTLQRDAVQIDGVVIGSAEVAAGGNVPAPVKVDTKKELAALLGPTFQILAPGWQVSAQEVDLLAESYADVLDKYFPGGVSLGVEVNAVLCTFMIFGPRWGHPRKLPKGQQQQQQQPTRQAAPQQPPAASVSTRQTGGTSEQDQRQRD